MCFIIKEYEEKMEEKEFISKLSWSYRFEKMSGKDNTYIIRRRDGLISAFIEINGNNIISFRSHQNRRLPTGIVNIFARRIIEKGYHISDEAAIELGISVIELEGGRYTYISSEHIKKYGLSVYENSQFHINTLLLSKLSIPSDTKNCTIDFHQAKVNRLIIKKDTQAEIDLRENFFIKEVLIGDNFVGKIYLSENNIKKIKVGKNCSAEIVYTKGRIAPKIYIGSQFKGYLQLRNTQIKKIRIARDSKGKLRVQNCIIKEPIDVGKNSSLEIDLSTVYCPYIYLRKDYSGHLKEDGQPNKQGIRAIFTDNDFSGQIDLSLTSTIQRLEIGKNSSGNVDSIGCKSIEVIKIDSNFSGEIDCRESSVVYMSVETPCQGSFFLSDATRLALLSLPKMSKHKIFGVGKPLSFSPSGKNNINYKFKEIKLPRIYFKSLRPTDVISKIFN